MGTLRQPHASRGHCSRLGALRLPCVTCEAEPGFDTDIIRAYSHASRTSQRIDILRKKETEYFHVGNRSGKRQLNCMPTDCRNMQVSDIGRVLHARPIFPSTDVGIKHKFKATGCGTLSTRMFGPRGEACPHRCHCSPSRSRRAHSSHSLHHRSLAVLQNPCRSTQ